MIIMVIQCNLQALLTYQGYPSDCEPWSKFWRTRTAESQHSLKWSHSDSVSPLALLTEKES